MATVQELEKKINALREADPDSPKLKAYEAELAALQGKSASPGGTDGVIVFDDVSDQDYALAGSKFIVIPPGRKDIYLDIEVGFIDWDNRGVSMKVPVTVVEPGVNYGKPDKLSFGVKKDGIWKGKDIYKAITGSDMPFVKGSDGALHPAISPSLLAGKRAVGYWALKTGYRHGDPQLGQVSYPKLENIFPEGSKPEAVGI